jgi:hypothetical protein
MAWVHNALSSVLLRNGTECVMPITSSSPIFMFRSSEIQRYISTLVSLLAHLAKRNHDVTYPFFCTSLQYSNHSSLDEGELNVETKHGSPFTRNTMHDLTEWQAS